MTVRYIVRHDQFLLDLPGFARSDIFGDANRRDGAEPAWHGAARLNENPSRLRATESFLAPIRFINCAIRPSLQIEPPVKSRILVNLACHADDKERGANNISRSSSLTAKIVIHNIIRDNLKHPDFNYRV